MSETTAGLDGIPDLSVRDVAAAVGLSYHAILRAARRGEVRSYKICGRLKFRRADVLAWIDACLVELERQDTAQEPAPPPERGSLDALRELDQRRRAAEHGNG